MSGLVLRLAGPLQSWGERSAFAERDTAAYPTRSGLIGLFAGAMGLDRHAPLDRFADVRLTIRVDSPGLVLTDFHTVGGGFPPARTVPTAEGTRRSGETATIVTRRRYLADAVFTVAVTGPEALVDEIGRALARPRWHPYLGRRACPPDEPFLLGWHADPERELRERVPLPDRPHLLRREDRTVEVDLLTDTPPADEEGESTPLSELADDPYSFAPLDRRYRRRAVYRQTVALPCSLVHQLGQDYQQALFTYARAGRKKP